MLFLVLGRGKTGSFVADVAKERGHGVRVVGEEANRDGSAITATFLGQFDAVIDFTTPEAVLAEYARLPGDRSPYGGRNDGMARASEGH